MTGVPAPAGKPWLVSFPALPEAAVDLVCFPHAGGGTVMYHPWSVRLRAVAAVRAVQLPGRETRLREAPAAAIAEIVEPVARALAGLGSRRPLVLFGHSFGAILAYEVARRVIAAGEIAPAMLVVSGRHAPHLPGRAPRFSHLDARAVVLRADEVYGGIPMPILEEPDLVAEMGRVIKEDLMLADSYACADVEALGCPIFAAGGLDDRLVSRVELEGWAACTKAAFTCAQFAGDHFYLRGGAGQQALLAAVEQACASAATSAE
jgi:medium-chain acyl-[acyl-carrier-protein] hydrolase